MLGICVCGKGTSKLGQYGNSYRIWITSTWKIERRFEDNFMWVFGGLLGKELDVTGSDSSSFRYSV
jgi:hypothetical protein